MGRDIAPATKRDNRRKLAKRLLKGLAKKEAWALEMLKRYRWTPEKVAKWASGDYHKGEKRGGVSREEYGMRLWKLRFGE